MWPYGTRTYLFSLSTREGPCEMGVPKYTGVVVSVHRLHRPGRHIKIVRAPSRSFGEWGGTRTKSCWCARGRQMVSACRTRSCYTRFGRKRSGLFISKEFPPSLSCKNRPLCISDTILCISDITPAGSRAPAGVVLGGVYKAGRVA